eukprot:644700-Hanusia_phi.AAC.1
MWVGYRDEGGGSRRFDWQVPSEISFTSFSVPPARTTRSVTRDTRRRTEGLGIASICDGAGRSWKELSLLVYYLLSKEQCRGLEPATVRHSVNSELTQLGNLQRLRWSDGRPSSGNPELTSSAPPSAKPGKASVAPRAWSPCHDVPPQSEIPNNALQPQPGIIASDFRSVGSDWHESIRVPNCSRSDSGVKS